MKRRKEKKEENDLWAVFVFFFRWRDVKIRAFDNAKHRTYVDLKVTELCNRFLKTF
jgi:hypothetical protein